jgi:hypothetical protein
VALTPPPCHEEKRKEGAFFQKSFIKKTKNKKNIKILFALLPSSFPPHFNKQKYSIKMKKEGG